MKSRMSCVSQKITLLTSILIMLLPVSCLFAQTEIELINGIEINLKSTVLEEERVISICLPADYDLTTEKYPVLYLLDGETHFQHASVAVNFLSTQNILPKMIVVAINNVDRNRDFTPIHDVRTPTSGGAEKFIKFLSDELTGYINENYRASNFSIIMGHSLGGVFAAYSLFQEPELFDAYLAISPFFQYSDNYIVKEADKMLKPIYDNQKYFYMTVGDEPDYFLPLKQFASLIQKKSRDIIDFEYTRMEGENHGTIPYLAVFHGLKFVFSDWQLPQSIIDQGLSAIDDHYKALTVKYGMDVSASEIIINTLGYSYLGNNNIEEAIIVFIENVKRYPDSSNVYDSLGEAYENNGQTDLAQENYQKAYDIGKEQNNLNTVIYLNNLNRVKQK